jgi:hypothetical protein
MSHATLRDTLQIVCASGCASCGDWEAAFRDGVRGSAHPPKRSRHIRLALDQSRFTVRSWASPSDGIVICSIVRLTGAP